MTVSQDNPLLLAEESRLQELAKSMIAAYLDWPSRTVNGETLFTFYSDLVEFASIRVETASACLELIHAGHVADALALCRGLFENYLLLVLMARGTKFVVSVDLSASHSSRAAFAEHLKEEEARIRAERDAGESRCLEVQKHPRKKFHLNYIFEGLESSDPDDQDVSVPYHFFLFQDFRPDIMRLNPNDYFDYFLPPLELKKALAEGRQAASVSYHRYLSYDALLDSLALNGLIGEKERKRVDAHYTFLGRFVHPTHDAARELHEDRNVHSGAPSIGLGSSPTTASRLLALAYVCHLLAGVFGELCGLYDDAPSRYIAEPGTTELRRLLEEVDRSVAYLWFVHNDAPPYDRFKWSIYFASEKELREFGGFSGVPSHLVSFDSSIYSNFRDGLSVWSNAKCGRYVPPIGGFA